MYNLAYMQSYITIPDITSGRTVSLNNIKTWLKLVNERYLTLNVLLKWINWEKNHATIL